MRFFLWPGALLLLTVSAFSQRVQISPAQAQQFEASLKANPNNRAARAALLDYYYLGGGNSLADAIESRRRHILWLIENTPEDELAGGPSATIDAAGYALADPQGFKLASIAWRAQIGKANVKPATLVNAAYFFKLNDKDLAISLLEHAVAMQPANKEYAARLGDVYALAIMGVTMINKNGYPLETQPGLTQSPAAAKAREALKTSRNPYALAKAGYMLSFQGSILYYSRELSFDTAPLAEAALQRAVSLAPGDREVAAYLAEHRAIQSELQKGAPAKSPKPTRPAVAAAVPTSAPAGAAANPLPPPFPVAPPAPVPSVSRDDLKKVTTGMNREQLLGLGTPSSRMSQDEDGHLVEMYRYYSNDVLIGRVQLTDGVVSGVQLP